MQHGDILYMPSLKHTAPRMQASFKAPNGKTFVLLLLGVTDKQDPDAFDANQALRDMGWRFEED